MGHEIFDEDALLAFFCAAPYILDGLLMNEAGRKIKEQYADTGGFTDLVFAATSLLGYMFRVGNASANGFASATVRRWPRARLGRWRSSSESGPLRHRRSAWVFCWL